MNIITIEDPIEFLHRDINCQHLPARGRHRHADRSAQALRHVLRQDPDVILIGEIRDLETLDTALKAADTGHLVFSTLHTTDATQTINRVHLVLSAAPAGRRSGSRCSSTALAGGRLAAPGAARGRPGRVPACEVLINTAAVRDNIRDIEKALNIPDLIAEGTVHVRHADRSTSR